VTKEKLSELHPSSLGDLLSFYLTFNPYPNRFSYRASLIHIISNSGIKNVKDCSKPRII